MDSKAKLLPQRHVQFQKPLTSQEEKNAKRQVISDFWKWYHSRLSYRTTITDEEAERRSNPQQYFYQQHPELLHRKSNPCCMCPCHRRKSATTTAVSGDQRPASGDQRPAAVSLTKVSKSSSSVPRVKGRSERRVTVKCPNTVDKKPSTIGRKASTHSHSKVVSSTRIGKSASSTANRISGSTTRRSANTVCRANETIKKVVSYAGEMQKRYQIKPNNDGNHNASSSSRKSENSRPNVKLSQTGRESEPIRKSMQNVEWQSVPPPKEKPIVGILKKRF